jgi:UDP-N-acetylmuramoyl-L-alanyl-D-glutamate--2,6-diaminopimelate ligase
MAVETRTHRLGELLAGFATVAPEHDIDIAGVAIDSREIEPGFLFLACHGHRTHGAAFIREAELSGAIAIAWDTDGLGQAPELATDTVGLPVANLAAHAGEIAARFFDHPSEALTLIGITGTNGKTSCSQILAAVLSDWGQLCGIVGTLGYGLPGRLAPPTHTTPDAVRLQRELDSLRTAGAEFASLEVSSHALDQRRVAGCRFHVAVFTNLSREHLEYHPSFEAYGAAKRRLFDMPDLAYAVINVDDPFGAELAAACGDTVQPLGYGFGEAASVRGTDLTLDAAGLRLAVATPWGEGLIRSPLLGRFNAYNLLAVLGVLMALRLPFQEACERLGRAPTVPGRMECFRGGPDAPLVIVDYAHSPDALAKALDAARAHCRGTLWCVFGCGGERDAGKRPEMGRIAATLADQLIITDDNPRGENAEHIVADIVRGIPPEAGVQVEHDRPRAITRAIAVAGPADVVLVAGKGHETVQIVGDMRRPYSDRETVKQLLDGEPPC